MLDDSFVDIDGELDNGMDETVKTIIKEYVPLDSVEKAKELHVKLQETGSEYLHEMYSSALVQKLVEITI